MDSPSQQWTHGDETRREKQNKWWEVSTPTNKYNNYAIPYVWDGYDQMSISTRSDEGQSEEMEPRLATGDRLLDSNIDGRSEEVKNDGFWR